MGEIDYSKLPAHMRDAMVRYIEWGIEGGSFLNAVLCNDLMTALSKADDVNRVRLFDYGAFLYCDAPSGCYGSREAVAAWIAKGGLNGLAA